MKNLFFYYVLMLWILDVLEKIVGFINNCNIR